MPIAAIPARVPRLALLNALAASRLPHALLFHGPPGVGKRQAALDLAQALLCPAAAPDACAACNTCRRVVAGLHPDLSRLEPDGQFIRVEAARELVRDSYLRPYEGRAKVCIISPAERLNEESGNTLLKTLEEPPEATYLILITANREAVLPTLRSRCQALPFTAPPFADLRDRIAARGGGLAGEAALRARLAGGDEERALALDLEALRAARRQALALLTPLAQGRLGPAEAEGLIELAEKAAGKDGSVDGLLFELLRPLARDALLLASGGPPELLLHGEAGDALAQLAAALGSQGAAALLADLDLAEVDFKGNANRKLLVEAVLAGVYTRART